MSGAALQSSQDQLPSAGLSVSESDPLLHMTKRSNWSVLARRYRTTRKCISSKAALAILLWSFTVSLMYGMILNPDSYTQMNAVLDYGPIAVNIPVFCAVAIIYCFYPIAGYLADNKFGRYKTIKFSLCLLLPSSICLITAYVVYLILLLLLGLSLYTGLVLILLLPAVLIMTISFVGFYANVIQFGVDQLYDFPGEDQSLFIHWYVWTYHITILITQLSFDMVLLPLNIRTKYISFIGIGLVIGISPLFFFLLVISFYIACRKRIWFLIEPSRVNPYKLVYKVFQFARQHKVPVNRSAFTYCEDEVPSGLDLGKDKYGGPFTTEQVEDVKVFYGILKVLFSLGPVFFLNFAANTALYQFTLHGSSSYSSNGTDYISGVKYIFINNGLLSPLLTSICIPLYLFLLRPLFSYYIPGMLKRMGIGMILMVVSIMCTAVIYIWPRVNHDNLGCMFNVNLTLNDTSLMQNGAIEFFLLIQRMLSSLSDMLIYIALYEFICSQSPHSMKGLLIGLSYAIKGLFQTAATVVLLPFALIEIFPSKFNCGSAYYLVNTVVGLVTVLLYVWVARKYKYRERDEPSNIYRYAEDYYSKTQFKKHSTRL